MAGSVRGSALSLGLLSLLAQLWCTAAQPYDVCISAWSPFVFCDANEDPSTYSSYEVDLFRKVMEKTTWHGNDWRFVCGSWDPILEEIVKPYGETTCHVVAMGLYVDSSFMEAGVQFTSPTYANGLKVMVNTTPETSMWSFLRPFSWEVWVTTIAIAFLLGLALGIIEVSLKGASNNVEKTKEFMETSFFGIGALVGFNDGQPASAPSRFLIIIYGLVVLVLQNTYTANLAAQITAVSISSRIFGVSDLAGRKVGTTEFYSAVLEKDPYNTDATVLPWASVEDEEKMMEGLRNREYDALIIDQPVVDLYESKEATCQLKGVGARFEKFNQAIAFPPNFPAEWVAETDRALVKLQEDEDLLDQMENEYILQTSSSTCDSGISDELSPITWQQLLGLWIIGGSGLLVSIVAAVVIKCWKRSQIRRRRRKSVLEDGIDKADTGPPPLTPLDVILYGPSDETGDKLEQISSEILHISQSIQSLSTSLSALRESRHLNAYQQQSTCTVSPVAVKKEVATFSPPVDSVQIQTEKEFQANGMSGEAESVSDGHSVVKEVAAAHTLSTVGTELRVVAVTAVGTAIHVCRLVGNLVEAVQCGCCSQAVAQVQPDELPAATLQLLRLLLLLLLLMLILLLLGLLALLQYFNLLPVSLILLVLRLLQHSIFFPTVTAVETCKLRRKNTFARTNFRNAARNYSLHRLTLLLLLLFGEAVVLRPA
uniref:Ionotropic glutamate receptor C-terminal domain-containing protein n=1 Tax=Chromera velia CCMP2878 TaxID=1169474 RepID=A0A0G4HKJ0_9ALVE|eukprot:Cvel_28462.t1-p1 / transcript=Cvel_28462.t1 / gene=Cvel_28462 / organism=Chromera_velia_CCMP2878 / gene_product=Glutamate receptor 3.1, putative / transcript_product=Glutamate receptor 3.1, putative / location=Cvel_scaffold3729:1269-5676(+) / protein_length=711 / sequence_SO=supercontig / SO=protein_coding / is_pseudo=false